ncbi:DNA-directed RNA polymerase subunit omega [Priestia koreensis]|uniref:DNA-directed RNA polymerase subunit omega n=1 Tax=Priestia koreensis TaxID=284581 RepID=A0A0M0KPB7_9BACI|nr:DNA-directed RNA polymerase subunit omega [Priestia koreensis]KOO40701.1 DNA-directed RNA polymerase subunit omega [Priestia koreensis]MCM3003829.1 DNA-directed RNA polymerase subunit omega [Priestia koreensis]UNL83929.1 DNA-directed RNA polymerase subunit omega [Priestia koreensis]
MLYPSIDSLMTKLDSKYTLVTVAAKRARQLQTTESVLIDNTVSHKFVGKALEEINAEALRYETRQED